mmetsp:Transcript_25079/g.49095  ORF Transcript_25079/g.49095 Transcript_25079/m.49095 type:complete len:549 (-) Transcript_25079:60-1706(-)|eukprot:CAMPEP_0172721320 /NCGR_PEP_ID=MMETSP1074-20121228/78826_1 /TAXON_ID=2916 /ORGANISM="Ceratium fusus, Strain PA161109" /LENGTH=548 /DNA_ID=CAMNT_0013547041 /DNA_START=40 /DNA_END=1686 /DNA_ORIENTATION=+
MAQKALKIGMELQAKYTDGAFYHATVLDVRKTGSKPVLVHYKGHGYQADCWLPLTSLKSKVLTVVGTTQLDKGSNVGKGRSKGATVIVESLAPPSMAWKVVQPSDPPPIISKAQPTSKQASASPQGLVWKPVLTETTAVSKPATKPPKQTLTPDQKQVWKPVKPDATPQTQTSKTSKPTPPPSGTQLWKKKAEPKHTSVWKPVTTDKSPPSKQKPEIPTLSPSKGRVWKAKSDLGPSSAKVQSETRSTPTLHTQARNSRAVSQVWRAVKPIPLTRGIIQTKLGGMHYVSSGNIRSKLTPILAFHMNPRSADEYREVMQLLSKDGRLVIAVDEFGYGASDNPNKSCTLEEIADAALAVAGSPYVKSFVACGSQRGNCLALALAKRQPQRMKAAILTHCYMWPKEQVLQQQHSELEPFAEDGAHLMSHFNAQKGWLDPEMNTRATIDCLVHRLKTGEQTSAGISIQDAMLFEFEAAARSTKCPVLAINSIDGPPHMDALGLKFNEQFEKLRGLFAKITVPDRIPGHVDVINTNPKGWTAEVSQFLKKHGL